VLSVGPDGWRRRVGRGAAWLVMFPMSGCPSAERAAAENADTAIALHPGGVEHRDIHGRHGLAGVRGTVAVSTAATNSFHCSGASDAQQSNDMRVHSFTGRRMRVGTPVVELRLGKSATGDNVDFFQ
jgi:hypothetical protein